MEKAKKDPKTQRFLDKLKEPVPLPPEELERLIREKNPGLKWGHVPEHLWKKKNGK